MDYCSIIHSTIAVDNRPVHCRLLAPSDALGTPVFMLHGLCCSSAVRAPTLCALGRMDSDRTAIALDFPGSGFSESPAHEPDIAALADWTIRLMDRIEIPRAHVAAHSMGCQVALETARRHPCRVASLVLAGPTLGHTMIPPWRYSLGLFANLFLEPVRFNCLLIKMSCQMGVRRCFQSTFDFLRDRPLAHACEVCCPALVIRGEKDVLVPDTAARRLAIALPHGAYERVARTTHAVQFNRPEFFAARLERFLAMVEGAACDSRALQGRLSCR